MKNDKAVLLSIGIIYKNDIRCIERCLKSLKKLREIIPCQLVMGDTGSSDGSHDVAEKYADIHLNIPWKNDFSDARNRVLERCIGDFYFSIDTDEWLDPDISKFLEYLKIEQPSGAHGEMVRVRNYRIFDEWDDYADAEVPRLISVKGGYLRYRGRIHEQLCYTDASSSEAEIIWNNDPCVLIHHDGYARSHSDSRNIDEKNERNMKLLLQTLKERPEDPLLLLQCIQSGRNQEEIFQYALRAVNCLEEMSSDQKRNLAYVSAIYQNAVTAANTCRNYSQALVWLDEWQQIRPHSGYLETDGNAGGVIAAYNLHDYSKAVKYGDAYLKAAAKAKSNTKVFSKEDRTTWHMSLSASNRCLILYILIHCSTLIGDYNKAQSYIDLMAEERPVADYLPPLVNLIVLNRTKLDGSEIFKSCWEIIINDQKDHDRLLETFSRFGSESVSYSHEDQAVIYQPFFCAAEEYIRECESSHTEAQTDAGKYKVCSIILEAKECAKKREWRSAVSRLKKALELDSEMKNLIAWCAEEVQNLQSKRPDVSEEMKVLAMQIRTIMDRLPPDSEELLKIRESEIYKKMRWIIEDMNV